MKTMKREILFRGKKQSTGEWVYGSLITNEKPGLHTIAQVNTNPVQNGVLTGWCFGVLPETVGQFTGIADKAGKRIFEGDVLNVIGMEAFYTYVISYENGCFIATHTKIKAYNYKPLKWGNINRFNELSIEIEVIGNIHDNPKLL